MVSHPKHFIVIKDKQIELGDNISIEEDLDEIYNTANLELPDVTSLGLKTLRKFDSLIIYYNDFPTREQANNAEISDCKKIFTGYIHSVKVNESKTDGIMYTVEGRSTLGLAYERTTITKAFNTLLSEIMVKGLTETFLLGIIPYIYISSDIDEVVIKVDAETDFGKVIESIKDKYPIKIFQLGDGGVWITTPSFFNKKTESEGGVRFIKKKDNNDTIINRVFEYDLKTNVSSIDYGDITNNINTVIVYGLNTFGVAFDPIAYELQYQTSLIAPQNLSVLPVYRRDVANLVECRKIAYETLIDIQKSNTLTLDCYYKPVRQIGDNLKIMNSKIINEERLFTIKRKTTSINKNGISSTIVAYRTGLADVSREESTGYQTVEELLQSDILNIQDKLGPAAVKSQLEQS